MRTQPRIRRVFLGLAASLLSLLFVFATGEAVVRTLQRMEKLPRYSLQTLLTPNVHLNARLVRSDNPVLHLEYSPDNPNINSAGHRGAEFPLEKPPNTFRIAVLGDSVAYGYSVPLEEIFPTRLEARLNRDGDPRRFEVLNFAVSGYGTKAELELYRSKVRAYRPDLVLLAYVLNDPIPIQLLFAVNDGISAWFERYGRLSRISQFGAWLFLRWGDASERDRRVRNYDAFYREPEVWDGVRGAIAELAEQTERDGAGLVAVVFPLLLDFAAYPMEEYHALVRGELERNGIPHLDLLARFRREPVTALRIQDRDNTHPNARGHAIAAEEIHRFLRGIGALER